MRRSFLALALALPLVVLALGILRAERHLAHGRRWTFEVTGYDPRDLLRGHYIQYQLALNDAVPPLHDGAESCDENTGERCCLCLSADIPEEPALLQRTTCEFARENCEGMLATRYLDELRRYYIAEDRADELTRLFQDASRDHRARLIVAIDADGRPQIDTLLVDDVPIERAESPE